MRVEMRTARFTSPTHIRCISSILTPCELGEKASQCKSPKTFCMIWNEMWLHVTTLEVATRPEICVEIPTAYFTSRRHLCISSVSTPCEFGLNATQCKSSKPFCVISDEMSSYVKSLEVATQVKSVANPKVQPFYILPLEFVLKPPWHLLPL